MIIIHHAGYVVNEVVLVGFRHQQEADRDQALALSNLQIYAAAAIGILEKNSGNDSDSAPVCGGSP